MMILEGSCNASLFYAHLSARSWGRIESGTYWTAGMTEAPVSPTFTAKGNLITQGMQTGGVVTWKYENDYTSPRIWVKADASNIIKYVWEGDTPPVIPSSDPIPDTDQAGTALLPAGGRSAEISFFSYPDIQTLLSRIVALGASLPSWTSGTEYESFPSCEVLLRHLWQWQCAQRKLELYYSIGKAQSNVKGINQWETYAILWMRVASMILHDHPGKSSIPLVLSDFTLEPTIDLLVLT